MDRFAARLRRLQALSRLLLQRSGAQRRYQDILRHDERDHERDRDQERPSAEDRKLVLPICHERQQPDRQRLLRVRAQH